MKVKNIKHDDQKLILSHFDKKVSYFFKHDLQECPNANGLQEIIDQFLIGRENKVCSQNIILNGITANADTFCFVTEKPLSDEEIRSLTIFIEAQSEEVVNNVIKHRPI